MLFRWTIYDLINKSLSVDLNDFAQETVRASIIERWNITYDI
jgi:hypothetical protein